MTTDNHDIDDGPFWDDHVHPEEVFRNMLPFLKTAESDPSWRRLAACKSEGVKEFFGSGPTKKTKSMCSICVVSGKCLQFALDNDISYGIWGGVDSKQRRAMRA